MKVFCKEGSFNHYEGDSRRYIMVAVVNNLKERKDGFEVCNFSCINAVETDDEIKVHDTWTIRKTLSFGIAVCHPNDNFDLEVGKKIAIEKALRNKLVEDFKKTMTADDKAFVQVLQTAEPERIEVLKIVAGQ